MGTPGGGGHLFAASRVQHPFLFPRQCVGVSCCCSLLVALSFASSFLFSSSEAGGRVVVVVLWEGTWIYFAVQFLGFARAFEISARNFPPPPLAKLLAGDKVTSAIPLTAACWEPCGLGLRDSVEGYFLLLLFLRLTVLLNQAAYILP